MTARCSKRPVRLQALGRCASGRIARLADLVRGRYFAAIKDAGSALATGPLQGKPGSDGLASLRPQAAPIEIGHGYRGKKAHLDIKTGDLSTRQRCATRVSSPRKGATGSGPDPVP